MRKYTCAFGEEVDLDNPDTYKHLPDDLKKLDDMMFKEIGYSLVYMDYFPDRKDFFSKKKKIDFFVKKSDMYPDLKNDNGLVEINNVCYNQRLRVYKLIKNFSENRRENMKNLMWYKEQIFLFQDETENMC